MAIHTESVFGFMNNQRGFVFPFVLFTITIILLSITVSISLYQYDIELSKKAVDQYNIESLFQMARKSLMDDEEFRLLNENTQRNYKFPNGEVTVTISKVQKDYIHATFRIKTNQDSHFIMRHIMNKN